jgi:hypothetical protein
MSEDSKTNVISISRALTKRNRLFGTTTGKFKGQIVNKIISKSISSLILVIF